MKFKVQLTILFTAILTTALLTPAGAVIPQRGGGTIGGTVAPMIMPEISIDNNNNVVVLTSGGSDWVTLAGDNRPIMRTLVPPDQLDAGAWGNKLDGKAWNWQYGWANAAFNITLLPAGSKVWLEVLDQSPGLKTYDRNNNYAPIFGTDGSSNIWRWYETMSMSHNAYTIEPGYADLSATYKIYIGDATTGAPTAGYGYDTVTLTWTSIPEPATLGLMGIGIAYLLRRKH